VQVKVHPIQSVSALLAALASLCLAQGNPSPENATAVVLKGFERYDIVMLGEIHAVLSA